MRFPTIEAGYHYSDASRASDVHALPNVEIFHIGPGDTAVDDEGDPLETGWYYAFGFPGCTWDADPVGPYPDAIDALADARSDSPIFVRIGAPFDVTRETDDGSPVWLASVVVYADPTDGFRDQEIDGSSWEYAPDLGTCYSVLMVSGSGDPDTTDGHGHTAVTQAFDELCSRLRADGYDLREE